MWRILSEFCSKVPLTPIDSMSLSKLENTKRHMRKTHVQFVLKINFFISISALLDILPTTSHYTKIIFFILYNAMDNTGVHIFRSLVQRKHVSLFKQSNKHKTRLLFIEVINHSHLNIKNTTVIPTKLQPLLNKEPVTKFTYVLLTLKYTFCRTHWRS